MSDSSFIPERPLVFSPALAQTIGLEEAILLQHLDELYQHRQVQHHKGRDWLRVERHWLLETLPFWSAIDLHRISKSLADRGLILIDSPPLHDTDVLVFVINDTRAAHLSRATGHATVEGNPDSRRRGNDHGGGDNNQAAATPPHAGKGAGLMAASWTPGEELLQLLALNHGIPRQFALDQLEDFVCYWRERGEVCHAWENRFRQQVLSRWRHAEQSRAERFTQPEPAITDDWYPSADALDILEKSGINRVFIDDAVAEFVLYWRECNPRVKAPNTKFIADIRRQWAHYTSALSHDTEPRRIPDNWQPTADVFDILKMAHIDARFARDLLPEFVVYWRDSNRLYNSWNSKFLQHVKYKWAEHNGLNTHGRQQGSHTTGRTRDRSLADDLADRSWAH